MADSRRGAKTNQTKHPREHEDWMKGKKIGRRKQMWDAEAKQWKKS